jgi:DnaJ-class molecular chaperone
MPRLRRPEEHGDLLVRLDVRLPTKLTLEQRELFEQLRRTS